MRVWIAAGLALITVPATVAGAFGFGLPLTPARIVGLGLAALIAWPLSRPLFLATGFTFATRRWIAIVAAVAALAASAQLIRLSVFMTDPTRTEYSASPSDPFRTEHSCTSAYTEGARFAAGGALNIYDVTLYIPRRIGALKVDPYHYPPPFLLLPQGLRVVAPEFVRFRALWFAMQLLLIVAAFVAASIWISGVAGATVLAGGALILALPGTLFSLQQGNFQLSATPLSVAGFTLLLAGRLRSGAAVLAWTAAAKIFPGILVVHLAAARRWRALGWVAAMAMALVIVMFLVQGVRPTSDFVTHAMPQIADGSAFPHTEQPGTSPVNWTVYGLTVRLRHLGVPSMSRSVGLTIASVYGIVIIALAAFAGWRRPLRIDTPSGRLAVLQIAVALVGLASFRSPFAGAYYGSFSTLCLAALLAAGTTSYRDARLWMIATAVYGLSLWRIPSPIYPPTRGWLLVSAGLVVVTVALNIWAAVRAVRSSGSLPGEAGEAATYIVPRRGAPAASAAPM